MKPILALVIVFSAILIAGSIDYASASASHPFKLDWGKPGVPDPGDDYAPLVDGRPLSRRPLSRVSRETRHGCGSVGDGRRAARC